MINYSLKSITVITLILVVCLFMPKSMAQTPASTVLVWPNVIDLDFSNTASKFASKSVYVENKSNKPQRIRAYTQGWNMNEYGIQNFLDTPDERTLNVMFNPKEFEIAPGEKQRVRISAKLPEGAEGEFRSIIFFESVIPKKELLDTNKEKLKVTLSFVTRYGVTVYAYKGNLSKNLTLEKFEPQVIDSKQYLVCTLKNEGNIHAYAFGEVTLIPDDGSEEVNYKLKKYTVLPESTQKMVIKLPAKKLSKGKYKAHFKLTYNSLENEEQLFETETSFNFDSVSSKPVNNDLKKTDIEEEIKMTPDNVADPIILKN